MATKLYLPAPRRGFVARPRLRDLLDRGAEPGLTLVAAPAGFGKTALLADWFSEGSGKGRCAAWLSLDPTDSEPGAFWAYVIASLRTAAPGVGSAALELLGSSPSATELMLTSLVNDLVAVPHDVWLVLDDYHSVDSGAVSTGVAYFLEHLPPQVHVVLSTRADPDLPLSRWRARGRLAEIRAADLRFTPDEAAAYLSAAGLELTDADVATLEQRTEGWIAALQLAVLSLRGRPDPAGFIESFAGNDRYIVDYLVDEVLEHQPAAIRQFLLHTAILSALNGPLCDAVTAGGDGINMLVALERANLFVIPLDDQREWYRYHHLFADVLRGRLLSEEPGQIPQLHQRASRWYESQGLLEDAVRHAMEGRDFDRAAHLVESAVPMLRRSRQDALLFSWLKMLPDAAIRRSPLLSVFYGGMLMVSGDFPGVEARLADAERALADTGRAPAEAPAEAMLQPGDQEWRMLGATIAIYRASLAQARGDAAETSAHARNALDLAGPDHHLVRGAAGGFLGLAAWADGDVHEALRTFTEAVASLHAAGNLLDELSSTVILADMWLSAGRPGQARRIYHNALRQAESLGDSMVRASSELHVGLSEVCRQSGDLNGARLHLEAAEPFAEREPMTESLYRWYLAKGLVAQDEGSPEAALSYLDHAEQLFRPGFFPDVRPIPAVKARIRVRRGDLAEAAGWARAQGISVTDEARYLDEYSHLTFARLLIAQQRAQPDSSTAEGVVGLLDRLLAAAAAAGRAGSVLEIRMLQALAQDALGSHLLAREMLGTVLAGLSEPDEYVRLFLDEGPPMLELLRAATHDGGAAAAHRLLALEASMEPPPAAHGGQPPSGVEPLSARELQVLRHLDSELSGPEIARALFISHNTLRTHTRHVFTKLGVTSRRAAVRTAHDLGLL